MKNLKLANRIKATCASSNVYIESSVGDKEFAAELQVLTFCDEFVGIDVEDMESTDGATWDEVKAWAMTPQAEREVLEKVYRLRALD